MKRSYLFIVSFVMLSACATLQSLKQHIDDMGEEPRQQGTTAVKRAVSRIPSAVSQDRDRLQRAQAERRSPWDSIKDDRLGSLWGDQGQDNFYFSKNIKRRVGDIIILKSSSDMSDYVTQKLDSYFQKIDDREKKLAAKKTDLKKDLEKVDEKVKEKEKEPRVDLGDVTLKLDKDLGRGTFEAIGEKNIYSKNTPFVVSVSGIVKMEDILPDNSIPSARFLESKVVLKK